MRDMMNNKTPKLTVDVIAEKNGKVVLIRRKNKPFKDKLALPGGFVEYGETVEEAARREMKEETNLKVKLKEILGVYSDPERDPRGHTISTVFVAEIKGGKLKGKSDAKEAKWIELNKIKKENLAFDHYKIIRDYIKFKRNKNTYWSYK